jgi:hypothetical protein
MRIARLADLLAHKYELVSEGVPSASTVAEVKKELLNAYKLYVNAKTAKEPILQMLADAGETFSKTLVSMFEGLIASLDKHSNTQLFFKLNNMLGMINDMKNDKDFPVRSFIHDAVKVTKESERNYREHLKSKFEMIISRISSILEREAKKLKSTLPLGAPTDLEAGRVEPQRKDLSKEKLLMFMRSPAAQHYKLDNIDVMQKIIAYPDTKTKLVTLINSIDRGHIPIDGPEVMAEAQAIRKLLDRQEQTNLPALEHTPEKPAPTVSLFEEEDEGNQ